MNLPIRLLMFACLLVLGWIGSIQAHSCILPYPERDQVTYLPLTGANPFLLNRAKRMGCWEPKGAGVLIQINSSFWKTAWFLLLVLIGLVCTGFWTVVSWNRQRRLQRELVRKKLEADTLQEMDMVKSQFFTNITHEFRTPLTIILNAHEQLVSTTLTQQQQQQTAIIQRHTHQLLRLITETLDMARMDAGKLEPSALLGDPVAFVSEVVAQFGGLAGQSGIDLTFTADKQIKPSSSHQTSASLYSFDGNKWEKIAYNLLANALRFTPAGGSVRVTGRISGTGRFVLGVADTGIGIPDDQLTRIFERFHQVNAIPTKDYPGTGIGLALVRELTDWLGGSILVKSEIGRGTVFTVELPLVYQGPIELMPSESAPPQRQPVMEIPDPSIAVGTVSVRRSMPPDGTDKPLVLVVEDNKDLRLQLTDFLAAQYRILSVPNGRQGLEQALTVVPDLIVSDVMMPEMDGYELVERLKADERTSHIPVILLTARSSSESRMKGFNVGADDYLGKPFSLTELALRIGNVLRTRQNWQRQFLTLPVLTMPVPTAESNREARFLSRLHQAILDHIELETLDVDWLASQAGMSRTQLHRKLTALTNLSPNRYIHRVRLERAVELLQAGEMNVAQVAYQVGYNSQSYFAKVFQDHFGYSPAKLKGAK